MSKSARQHLTAAGSWLIAFAIVALLVAKYWDNELELPYEEYTFPVRVTIETISEGEG